MTDPAHELVGLHQHIKLVRLMSLHAERVDREKFLLRTCMPCLGFYLFGGDATGEKVTYRVLATRFT